MACQEHVVYCFDVLHHHFHGWELPVPEFADHSYPLFVTWHKESSRGEQRLRGCIGTFTAQPLHRGLKEYALSSALSDRRFDPMRVDELPLLHCSVSLLHDFERAATPTDWELGRHGINIEFKDPVSGKRRHATYLPEVAPEQGWNHIEALDSLIKKAGYTGRITTQLRESLVVERYQSSKASLSYRQYISIKNLSVENLASDKQH